MTDISVSFVTVKSVFSVSFVTAMTDITVTLV